MSNITEPQREIPVVRNVDVLVVGGGTAGVPAALCAARLGAKTMLVERHNAFGGAITVGMTITLPAYPIVGAAFNEIMRRMQDQYRGVAEMTHECRFVVIDQEMYKYEAMIMLEEAGVEILLNTLAVETIAEDGAVGGIIIENKSGRQAIRAKVVVDCTGDADIAFRSGAETVTAPKDKLEPITLMWLAANVDVERVRKEDHVGGCDTSVHPGEINVWGGTIRNLDGADAWDLTRAEIDLRKQSIAQWLDRRANWPGWEDSYIGHSAPHLGVRETRRLVGQYVVQHTEMKDTQYDDSIGTAQHDGPLPYRAMVPRDTDSLLVAGRCVSTDSATQHTIRIAPTCALLGEAAGTAAALCTAQGMKPRELPADVLRPQLVKQGVYFGALGDLPKKLQ